MDGHNDRIHLGQGLQGNAGHFPLVVQARGINDLDMVLTDNAGIVQHRLLHSLGDCPALLRQLGHIVRQPVHRDLLLPTVPEAHHRPLLHSVGNTVYGSSGGGSVRRQHRQTQHGVDEGTLSPLKLPHHRHAVALGANQLFTLL